MKSTETYSGFVQDIFRIYTGFIQDLLKFTGKCPAYENW